MVETNRFATLRYDGIRSDCLIPIWYMLDFQLLLLIQFVGDGHRMISVYVSFLNVFLKVLLQ